MNASRFVPVGVIVAGVPDVVAIDRFGLMRAVKPSVTRRWLARPADVTGISAESGISSLTASECNASQKPPPKPAAGQYPVVPVTLAPDLNSGFDGIVAPPVYRPIFGLASCRRGAG